MQPKGSSTDKEKTTGRQSRSRKGDSPAVQAIKANITDPRRWVNPEHLLEVMRDNPSLRGFTYGYMELIIPAKGGTHEMTRIV